MTTSNRLPGYGAIPGTTLPVINGQFLTANGANGTNWMHQGSTVNAVQSVFEIRNDESTIVFNTDGTITTKAGAITTEDWITVTQLMKRLIMDMSKDPDMVSKYPYIQDTAHDWLMKDLKG